MTKGPVIAVMQPYFIPYGGYFRLFATADVFVVYDCVQFPRRGWVHRNRLPDANGNPRWLTLPLQKASREVRIADLAFGDDARQRLEAQLRAFPSVPKGDCAMAEAVRRPYGKPLDFILSLLKLACSELALPFNIIKSSSLEIPGNLRGQDRVLAIVRAMGGRTYLNAPSGREIYDPRAFAEAGIDLRFLPDFKGTQWSILHRLCVERACEIRAEVLAQTRLLQ